MSTFTSQTQLGPVQVKSYWSTLADLFASCCGARDRKDKTQYERLLDQQEDSTRRKLAQSNVLLRWLALLISGQYFPDNQQIYAVLFRFAGVLDGLAASGGSDDNDGDHPQGSLGQSTIDILNETQTLLKDVARWFTADDAVIDQRHIPNGNSRHQLQRIIFHSSQLMRRNSVPAPDIETAKEVVPELATVQKSAEQAVEDLRLALYSTARIVITLLTCNQLLDTIRDAINFGRDITADAASATAEQVSHIETAVRPSEQERTEPAKDQAIELKHDTTQQATGLRQGAQQFVAQAAQINTANIKIQVEQVSDDLSHRAKEKLPSKDSMIDRFLTVVQELIQSDDAFREAIQSLLALAQKYTSAFQQAAKGVVPQDLVVEGASQSNEHEHQPTPPSLLESNPHLTQLLVAGKEFLEGLAGGKSLDPVLADCRSVWSELQTEFLQAFDDWTKSTTTALERDDGDVNDKASLLSQSIRNFIDTIRGLLQSRQDLQDQLTHIRQRLSTFTYEITRETRLRTMTRRLTTIKSVLLSVCNTQTATLTQHGRELLNDTFNKILPALLHLLGSIPLPRVEFTSPQLDAALDDLSLAAVNLFPAAIRFEARESFEWNRISTASTTLSADLKRLRVEATGLRLAFRDVSFFVREKLTQTSSQWLNWICCALPSSRSGKRYTLAGREEEGHLGAYRDAGLVDVGLFGEGGTEQGAEVAVEVQGQAESERRASFFKVTSTSLSLSDSFKFHLHETHHGILNTLLIEPIASPAMRLVIQYTVQSLLKHGVEHVDSILWDYHQRAKKCTAADQHSPGVKEYVRVVMDGKAGKSPERIERERKEQEQEEEEERQQRQQSASHDNDGDGDQRPKVEVKPMAIILNPTPDMSISIGAYPSLLPTYAQGSSTRRVTVRNAVVHNEWRSLVANRATDTLDELSNGVQIARESQRAVTGAVKEAVSDVKMSNDIAEDIRDNAVDRREIADARAVDEGDDTHVDTRRGEDFEWYHEAFDL